MAADAQLHHQVHGRLQQIEQLYTRGRKSIVDALVSAGTPITLPELLDRAPNLTQSSTYRNLAMMEEAGVIRRLTHSSEHTHYELAEDLTEHHHHLICHQCGLIKDITLDKQLERKLDTAFHTLSTNAGFRPGHHDIDVFGTCADCADT